MPMAINEPICSTNEQGECDAEHMRKKNNCSGGILSKIACIQEGIELVLNTTDIVNRNLQTDDFCEKKTVFLETQSHVYQRSFKEFAPRAFTYIRCLFRVNTSEFRTSLCSKPLIPLEQLGRSGSLFFLTFDNRYIVKTVQHKETEFLQKLLPKYVLKLHDNPDSLLPRYYGLYSSKFRWHILRVIVMKNFFPSLSNICEQYDLKGSTYGRTAAHLGGKKLTTMKDLDFLRNHPHGLYLDSSVYDHIVNTITSDCLVLQNFSVMDYSLLIGVETAEREGVTSTEESESSRESRTIKESDSMDNLAISYRRFHLQYHDNQPYCLNHRIEARNIRGEKLYLCMGLIDILQNYNWARKAECFVKSAIYGKSKASVVNPETYARRFQAFISKKVFRQLPEIVSSSLTSYPTAQREFQPKKRQSLTYMDDQTVSVQENTLANNVCLKSVAKAYLDADRK